MKLIKTYLPVFTGFYGTIFEPCEDSEIDEINSQRKEKNLPEINFDQCTFNYDEYRNNVSIGVCEYIEKELKEINVLTSIKFESLYSPREYNFHNDSINIEIELSDENILNIKKFLYDNIEDFKIFLKDRYTSYSGFISHHPNTVEGWRENTLNFMEYGENEHYLGSVLEFICMINEIDNESMYYSLSDCNISCTNYYELIGESKE